MINGNIYYKVGKSKSSDFLFSMPKCKMRKYKAKSLNWKIMAGYNYVKDREGYQKLVRSEPKNRSAPFFELALIYNPFELVWNDM